MDSSDKRTDGLQDEAFVARVNNLFSTINELRSNAQTSDSQGIKFYVSSSAHNYDYSGTYTAPPTSPSVVGPTVRVRASASDVLVLLADVIVENVLVNGGAPIVAARPQRVIADDPKVCLWDVFIGVPLNQTSTVDLKVSVVANTNVTITAAAL